MDDLKTLLNRRPMTASKSMSLKLNLEALRHLENSLQNNKKVMDEIQDLISRPLTFFRTPYEH